MTSKPPAAWKWYVAYCWVGAALHAAWLGLWVWAHFQAASLTAWLHGQELYFPDFFITLAAGLFAPTALVFGGFCLWLPTLKPSKEAWSLHFTNIILGMLTVALAPFLIPLFLAWLKPEVKSYFGVGSHPRS